MGLWLGSGRCRDAGGGRLRLAPSPAFICWRWSFAYSREWSLVYLFVSRDFARALGEMMLALQSLFLDFQNNEGLRDELRRLG